MIFGTAGVPPAMSAKRENLISNSKLARLRRFAGGGARGSSKSLDWYYTD